MNERLRILWATQVYPRFAGDVMGSFLHRLARALVESGASVSVVAPAAASVSSEETLDGVAIHRFRYAKETGQTVTYTGEMHRQALRHPWRFAGFLWAFRRAVWSRLREMGPEIVHAHWWFPSGWVALAPDARAGARRVLSVHGTDLRLLRRLPLARPLARSVLARADLVLPVSSALDATIADLGVPPARRAILPMPADAGTFQPATAPRPDRCSFVVAARLTRQKRVDRAVRALARLRDEGRKVFLEVAGDGSQRPALEELSRELGLEALVTFHGMVSAARLAELLRAASAVVLTSEEEGYGLSLVEGGLCGTAAIGVRSGGITDLIEDGVTGFLVEPDDEAGLARALSRLAADPDLTEHMGRAAYGRARQGTAEPLAGRLLALYTELSRSES